MFCVAWTPTLTILTNRSKGDNCLLSANTKPKMDSGTACCGVIRRLRNSVQSGVFLAHDPHKCGPRKCLLTRWKARGWTRRGAGLLCLPSLLRGTRPSPYLGLSLLLVATARTSDTGSPRGGGTRLWGKSAGQVCRSG